MIIPHIFCTPERHYRVNNAKALFQAGEEGARDFATAVAHDKHCACLCTHSHLGAWVGVCVVGEQDLKKKMREREREREKGCVRHRGEN